MIQLRNEKVDFSEEKLINKKKVLYYFLFLINTNPQQHLLFQYFQKNKW